MMAPPEPRCAGQESELTLEEAQSVAGFENAGEDVELAPCYGCQTHRPKHAVTGVDVDRLDEPIPLCPDCRAEGGDE